LSLASLAVVAAAFLFLHLYMVDGLNTRPDVDGITGPENDK
jgi:hypothetical protein